jgi:hypothetical protein
MRERINAGPKLLRVRQPAAVRHPDTGELVVPTNDQPWRADDPLVMAYPWLFGSDEEIHAEQTAPPVESVRVESVRQRPGTRRSEW